MNQETMNGPAGRGLGAAHLLGRIVEIITSYTGQNPDEITRETKLREMGMDSLDMVEILMDAEQEWQCEISDEAVESLVTVGDAEMLIMQLRPNEKGQPQPTEATVADTKSV